MESIFNITEKDLADAIAFEVHCEENLSCPICGLSGYKDQDELEFHIGDCEYKLI